VRFGVKYFILLHFGDLLQSGERAVVQRTKIRLTCPYPLPRMDLLRRTKRRVAQDIAAYRIQGSSSFIAR
jgi:hypothetical protein